jgi:Nicastrin
VTPSRCGVHASACGLCALARRARVCAATNAMLAAGADLGGGYTLSAATTAAQVPPSSLDSFTEAGVTAGGLVLAGYDRAFADELYRRSATLRLVPVPACSLHNYAHTHSSAQLRAHAFAGELHRKSPQRLAPTMCSVHTGAHGECPNVNPTLLCRPRLDVH